MYVCRFVSVLFSHCRQQLENSFGFVYLENFVFAVTKDTTSNQTVLPMLLWASQDEGRTMREARFPETLTVNSQITIVDRTDAIALTLWINQNSDFFGGAGYGNLYLSDADGLEYARIIDRVRRRQAHSYDFYNPAGVDGSFFVNQVDEFSETEDFRTLISTDRGGLWRTLRAPVLKLDGTPRNCTNNNDCLLHLSFERLFRPVSTSAAVGMLLVHGMVGRRANTAPEVLQPFVSRDAGSTWSTTVPAGAYHAEIGFRGSIVTLAPNGQTSTLRYTLNEGQTWVTVRNAWQTMQVRDIEHHYSLETDDFVVEGVRFVNGSSRGVVVHIDFTPLNLRVCQGHEMPSSDASDYEYFTPSSTASGCLLGRVVKFIRRKQAVACVDLVENDDKIEETACVCQRADYECDFGYDLNPATLQCLPEPGFVPQTPSQQCSLPGATFYYESQGYRKVLGNQCTGGTIPARVQKSCVDVPRLTTTTTPPPTTTPLTTTMTTTTEMPPTTPPPITTAPSTTTPAPVPTTTMAPTQRTSAPTTVGECLTGGATCSTGGDCCQGFFCEQNRCSECAPAQCPDDVDMQNCQIEMTTDDVGCPKLVCTDCKPVNQEPDTAPPGGLGAGIIILIVALVLLCLGVVVWAAIKLRNRNRFEKHGVEGDTPMSAQDENQLADMQLESDSE